MTLATILIIIAVIFAVLIAAVLAYATTRPNELRVQRSTTITAPPELIFALIDDFHRWVEWSPYERMDPAMTKTFSGAPSGLGAVYEWNGNSKVGAGRMEMTGRAAPERVVIKLDFIRPFEGHNVAEFTLAPFAPGSTTVTWSTRGPSAFMVKVMGIFIDMDHLIGRDFAIGLANLKRLAEQR